MQLWAGEAQRIVSQRNWNKGIEVKDSSKKLTNNSETETERYYLLENFDQRYKIIFKHHEVEYAESV